MKNKVLWIVNNPLTIIREELGVENVYGGGWLDGLLGELMGNNELALSIACPYETDTIITIRKNGIDFFLVPGGYKSRNTYDKRWNRYWDEIIHNVNPDVIHIHGTEFAHVVNVLSVSDGIKKIASIQGLISEYWKYYFFKINKIQLLRSITIKDMLRSTSVYKQQKIMKKQSQNEIDIIKKVDYIFGRTEWDRIHCWYINKSTEYFYCGEILREKFYCSRKWAYEQCKKNRIFISQATYPIKGLHILLEAAIILKERRVDFEICIAGTDIFYGTFSNSLHDSNYARYLKRMIRKNKLENFIKIAGVLDEVKMVENLLKTNVFICSSGIENSPNSLGEAMLLGVPVVASYVGGIPSMINNEKCLFNGNDPTMLAGKIFDFFNDIDLQKSISKEEIEIASKRFDKKKIVNNLLENYRIIKNV